MPTRLLALPMLDDETPNLFGVEVEKWTIKTNYHDVAKVEVTAKADVLDQLKERAEGTATTATSEPEHERGADDTAPEKAPAPASPDPGRAGDDDPNKPGVLGPEKDPEKDPTPAGPSPQRDLPKAERGGGAAARPQER